MIDWIKAVIPLRHETRISGGIVQELDADSGEMKWSVHKRRSVEASHSAKIQARTITSDLLEIDGNPSKFLQGHNVFGGNNLLPIVAAFFEAVCIELGLAPSAEELEAWRQGNYILKRVDVAECFRLPSQPDVCAWLRAATGTIRGKHQSPSAYHGETIYLGQHSRRVSLKAYNKYRELLKHPPARTFPHIAELLEFAKPLLRLEVRLLSVELKRRGIHRASAWASENVASEALWDRIRSIKMNQRMRLTSTEVRDLPPRLQAVYKLWTQGEDLRGVFPRATFYRYRSEISEICGIDISVPQPRKAEVIPLVRYLAADHVAEVPDWANGTATYFDGEAWLLNRRIS